ncbi:MAG: RNA-binding S4 domain-containing protein [Firmicutes bacterium]|nr:RNA-binding S4 domain-containing protein [Bacillota bacterium]
MKEIKIDTDFVKLQQILKIAGVVGQGSDAKWLIKDGNVRVNGKVCTERGKKIKNDDVIEIDDKKFICKAQSIGV